MLIRYSTESATSIGSHTRMEAMLQKAARPSSRSIVEEEVMGADCDAADPRLPAQRACTPAKQG